MNCINCGAEVKEQTNKCEYCGNYIDKEDMEVKKKKKTKKLIGIFAALIGIAVTIAAVVVLSYVIRTPEETIEEYWEAAIEVDADKMLDLLYPDMVLKMCSQKGFTKKRCALYITEALNDSFENQRVAFVDLEVVDSYKLERSEVEWYEDFMRIELGDVWNYTVKITMRVNGEEIKRTTELTLTRIGLKWYLLLEGI